jgi:hypothetical protein
MGPPLPGSAGLEFIFDRSVMHLLKMGWQSLDLGEICYHALYSRHRVRKAQIDQYPEYPYILE